MFRKKKPDFAQTDNPSEIEAPSEIEKALLETYQLMLRINSHMADFRQNQLVLKSGTDKIRIRRLDKYFTTAFFQKFVLGIDLETFDLTDAIFLIYDSNKCILLNDIFHLGNKSKPKLSAINFIVHPNSVVHFDTNIDPNFLDEDIVDKLAIIEMIYPNKINKESLQKAIDLMNQFKIQEEL